MLPTTKRALLLVLISSLTGLVACDEEPAAPPETAPLEAPEAPPSSRTFSITSATSKAEFTMEAPLENIHGVAAESFSGDLFVDLSDLTKSRGLIRVDLGSLEIFQRKRETTDEELGEEAKNATQNEHAQIWLQISPDTPEEVRAANRHVQFNVGRISDASLTNVLEAEGDERRVTATIHGDFRLHSRTVEKSVRVELGFHFQGDQPTSVEVRTLEPVAVGLAEHQVRPRSAFGALAEATLATLGQKVADAAPITFEFTAMAGDAVESAPTTEIVESEAAEAALELGVQPE